MVAFTGCAAPPRPLPPPKLPKVAFDTLITSRPDAVRCTVNGASGTSMTVTTPRLVPMAALGDPVQVRCFADGYWKTAFNVFAGSRRPLLVRVLAGEQISPANAPVRGTGVGPGGEFPREVTIILRRRGFDTPAARDRYYAQQIRDAQAAWDPLIAKARSECGDPKISQKGRTAVSLPAACRDGLQRLRDLKRADLQLIEQQRRRSAIP